MTVAKSDITQRAAEAAKRRSNQSKSSFKDYCIYISVASIMVAAAGIVVMFLPEKNSSTTPVNYMFLINKINTGEESFRAGPTDMFEKWVMTDVSKTMEGVRIKETNVTKMPICSPFPRQEIDEQWDGRDVFPECFPPPLATNSCASSYAHAATSVLGSRYCMSARTKYSNLQLGPKGVLACSVGDSPMCDGGDLNLAFNLLSNYGTYEEACYYVESQSSAIEQMQECNNECVDEIIPGFDELYYTEPDEVNHFFSSPPCNLLDEESVQREIMMQGPIAAYVNLYDDFLVYKSGIYSPSKGANKLTDTKKNDLQHAIKIIGWGTHKKVPYWLIENNFGTGWGEDGFGKIKRGEDSILIKGFYTTGKPQPKPPVEKPIPTPSNTKVNNRRLMRDINFDLHAGFLTTGTEMFEEWMIEDVTNAMTAVELNSPSSPKCHTEVGSIASTWDVRDKGQECYQVPVESGACASSWAIATASVLSTRYCLAQPSQFKGLQLSAKAMMACGPSPKKCEGGSTDTGFDFAHTTGLVREECTPYNPLESMSCDNKCKSNESFSSTAKCVVSDDESSIQREIQNNGPVAAYVNVYNDFLILDTGVYVPNPFSKQILDKNDKPLVHAVTILGWGIEDEYKYWLIGNSFGKSWGVGGVGKIRRGDKSILVEGSVTAVLPNFERANTHVKADDKRDFVTED
eukprot:GHVL01009139.1.p1 GENE.GHVL01009139.1~~GHVL01009139.1.p1  ORF type:complete len:687 (-),score=87.60 GHVL01009139.1:2030-4090(-)